MAKKKGVSKPRKVSSVRFSENVQNRQDSYTKMGKYSGKKRKFGKNKVSSVGENNARKLATAKASASKAALRAAIRKAQSKK